MDELKINGSQHHATVCMCLPLGKDILLEAWQNWHCVSRWCGLHSKLRVKGLLANMGPTTGAMQSHLLLALLQCKKSWSDGICTEREATSNSIAERTRSLHNIAAKMLLCNKLQKGRHNVADTDRRQLTRK